MTINHHYEIIKAKYPQYINKNHCAFEYPTGWNSIIDDMFLMLDELCRQNPSFETTPQFECLKEKFGTGRFYFNSHSNSFSPANFEILWKFVSIYEDRTTTTCQICGSKDSILRQYKGHLLATMCDIHGSTASGWNKFTFPTFL